MKKKMSRPKIEYLMSKGCLMQPFIKLGVRKVGLGEFFGLPYNNNLIPHLELGELLLGQDIRVGEHLELSVSISSSKFMS
jgi:hypothetical protein